MSAPTPLPRGKASDYLNLREIVLTVTSPIYSVEDPEHVDELRIKADLLVDEIRNRGFSVEMEMRKVRPATGA